MAVEITNVIADLELRVNKYIADAKKAAAETDKIGQSVDEVNKKQVDPKLDTFLKKNKAAIDDFAGSSKKASEANKGFELSTGLATKALGLFTAVLASVGFAKFIQNSVQAAAQLDKAAQAFKIFGLNAQQAMKVVEELDSLAAKLPFEDTEVLQAGQNLLKFGFSAGEVVEVVKELSAVSIGSGISLERLTQILGRANTSGKVFGRDFLEVLKNAPGFTEAIATSTGKSVEQITKLGKAGKLTFTEFKSGLDSVTSATGKYGLALQSYQESFTGVKKEFDEALNDISEETGKGILKGFGELFKELTPIIKAAIPVFRVLGEVIGAVLTTISKFVSGAKNAITTLGSELEERLNRSGLTFGGRFIRKLTDADIFKKEIEGKGDIFGKLLEEAITKPVTKTRELTEEELKKLIEARQKFNDQLKAFNKELQEVLFGRDQEQLKNEGLTRLAEENKIIQDTNNRIEKLRDGFAKVKELAEAAGKSISNSVINQFEQSISALADSANERLITLQRTLEIPFKIRPGFQITQDALDANKIDEGTKQIVSNFLETLFDPKTNKVKLTLPDIEDVKSDGGGPSFFEKLIGDLNDPKVQEQLKTFRDQAFAAADTFIQTEIDKTDFLISQTEERINKLLQLQEGGSAKQIELEQNRLDRLNEQKAKFVEQQRAFAAIEIATTNAVTAAKSAQAIATAFSEGNIVLGIAASFALLATIASTIAQVQAQINSVPGLWEGAERVSDTGRPQRRGRDGFLRWLDGRERVLNPGENDQIPSFVKNSQIPRLVQIGLAGGVSFNDKRISDEQKETNKILKQIQKGQRKQSVIIKFMGISEQKRLTRMR